MLLVAATVLVADVREVIGFSSFAVLIYYAIANLAALTQPRADRRWPRALHVLGLVGCLTLVATLPLPSIAIATVVFAVGLGGRLALRALGRVRGGSGDRPD